MPGPDVTSEIQLVFAKAQGLLLKALELHGNRRLVTPPGKKKTAPKLTDEGERIMQRLIQEISKLTFLTDSDNLTTELIRNSRKKFMMDMAISEYPAGQWGTRKLVTCRKCAWPWFPKKNPYVHPPTQCPRCKANDPTLESIYRRGDKGDSDPEEQER